ncbi:Rz1-like lysis system protein LysC [Oxalobacter paeniformigenes]
MRRKTILSLLSAVLILIGCASSPKPSIQPTVPPLDSSLAADCKALPEPPDGDYDELTGWMVDVIGMYGECAARHKTMVRVWETL